MVISHMCHVRQLSWKLPLIISQWFPWKKRTYQCRKMGKGQLRSSCNLLIPKPFSAPLPEFCAPALPFLLAQGGPSSVCRGLVWALMPRHMGRKRELRKRESNNGVWFLTTPPHWSHSTAQVNEGNWVISLPSPTLGADMLGDASGDPCVPGPHCTGVSGGSEVGDGRASRAIL